MISPSKFGQSPHELSNWFSKNEGTSSDGYDSHLLDRVGALLGADQSSNRHDYLRTYQKLLTENCRVGDLVAILGHRTSHLLAHSIALCFPKLRILLLQLAAPPAYPIAISLQENMTVIPVKGASQADTELTKVGPVKFLIEDGSNKREEKLEIFESLFWHVSAGGLYVTEDLHAISLPELNKNGGAEILLRVFELVSDKRKLPFDRTFSGTNGERRDSISYITVAGKLLIIGKRYSHFRKITEDTIHSKENSTRLAAHLVRTITEQNAGEYTSKATFWCNREGFADRFPETVKFPALELREYADVRADPFQVVSAVNSYLPETFRLFRKPYVASSRIRDAGPMFARQPDSPISHTLEGVYYHLDNEFIDQFGHMTTDVLSRTWAFHQVKQRFPHAKVLVSSQQGNSIEDLKPWILPYLESAGIQSRDLVVIDKPVQIESLFGATPMFSNLGFAHPKILELWRNIRNHLAGQESYSVKEKIFVSRPGSLRRGCRNADAVEEKFTDAGFRVVFPERLSLRDQAILFASASAVAGYAGSGMINTFMCQLNIPKLVIASETFVATNEALIASVLGGSTSYFYCDADVKHPPGAWSLAAHRSEYQFDFSRDGAALEDWISRHA